MKNKIKFPSKQTAAERLPFLYNRKIAMGQDGTGHQSWTNKQTGVGAAGPSDPNYMAGQLNDMLNCGFTRIPVIEYVTWTVELPVLDANLNTNFNPTINLFQPGTQVAGVTSVDSSFVMNGLLQVDMLVVGFGIHIFGEPDQVSFICNYVNPAPAAGAVPVSPDAFTVNDVNNYALSPNISTAAQTITPAVIEWGTPVQQAMWHIANGYQFNWTYQQRNLLVNELVADVAYFGSYAEATGMGDSQQGVQRIARRVNDFYQGTLGVTGAFVPINAQRVGSTGTTGSGTAAAGNRGIFHPSRAYDLGDTAWGGLMVQNRTCNSPYRRLPQPVVLEKGIPIGFKLLAQDEYHVMEAFKYLSLTDSGEGFGGSATGPSDIAFQAAGGGLTVSNALTFLEIEFAAGADVAQQVTTDRVFGKGGALQIAFLVKGIELWGPYKNFIARHASHLVDCSSCSNLQSGSST